MTPEQMLREMAKAAIGDYEWGMDPYADRSRMMEIQAALKQLVEITGAIDEDGFMVPDVVEDLGYRIIAITELDLGGDDDAD